MEIRYLGNILITIGGLCLSASGFITAYYAGLKAGREEAINNYSKVLQENSDEKGICRIQTNIEG